jgi:hypothetical protein
MAFSYKFTITATSNSLCVGRRPPSGVIGSSALTYHNCARPSLTFGGRKVARKAFLQYKRVSCRTTLYDTNRADPYDRTTQK